MKDVAKALRWLAKETEFVFAAEQLREAADLIESLQADNAELRKANSEYQDAQHPLFMALSAAQRRADAAVADLHHGDACTICKHYDTAPRDCSGDCLDCSLLCACGECRDESKWEWRGAQAGEENE